MEPRKPLEAPAAPPPTTPASPWSMHLLGILRAALRGETGDVARGPLTRAIPLLAIPMVLEMAMEALFTLCDVIFVSQLGAGAVATVGITEALLALVYAAAFGLAMPATAVVARRFGEGDEEGAARSGAQAIWIGTALSLGIALSALFAAPLLTLMGASPEVVRSGTPFAAISFAASPSIVLIFVNNAVLRGAGDASRAMRALWLSNGINLALDPCLIFGLGPFPEMGVTGAAVATTLGRGIGVAYQLRHLYRGPLIRLRGRLALRPRLALVLLRRSYGGAMQHVVETGSWVILTRIVAGFGSEAVAGYTVAMRLIIFTLLPAWGFSNATATLVGQSLGAGDPARAERAVWLSGLYAMVFLSALASWFLFAPEIVVGLVSRDPGVVNVAATAVFIIAFGYVFYGWQMVTQQAFNGAGDTNTPALINAACFWLLQIPLALLLSGPANLGVNGVFIAVAACYSIAALVSIVFVRRGRWKTVVV